jgi:hypothetical protein
MIFEWDARKARMNHKKHGVSFEEAATIFEDEYALESTDERHSTTNELRFYKLGRSIYFRVLLCVFTLRKKAKDEETIIRIISARRASQKERAFYESANDDT